MTQEEEMDLRTKQNNRYKFRMMAFWLAATVMAVGGILSYLGKGDTFGAIAASVMTFATGVFVADYATKVETD